MSTVALVGQRLMGWGLRELLLRAAPWTIMVGDTVRSLLEGDDGARSPEVVVVIYPGDWEAAAVAAREARAAWPETGLVLLGHPPPSGEECSRLLQVGVRVMVPESADVATWRAMIGFAGSGMTCLPEAVTRSVLTVAWPEHFLGIEELGALPARQGEILERLRRGLTRREIADQLGINRGTVDSHLLALRRKAQGLGDCRVPTFH